MAIVYIGIGSNLGDRRKNMARALELMSEKVALKQVSSVYETEPVGFKQQPLAGALDTYILEISAHKNSCRCG